MVCIVVPYSSSSCTPDNIFTKLMSGELNANRHALAIIEAMKRIMHGLAVSKHMHSIIASMKYIL